MSRRHAFVAVPIQGLAANFLQSMKDYPPSQTSGYFNLEGFGSKLKATPAGRGRRAGRLVLRSVPLSTSWKPINAPVIDFMNAAAHLAIRAALSLQIRRQHSGDDLESSHRLARAELLASDLSLALSTQASRPLRTGTILPGHASLPEQLVCVSCLDEGKSMVCV